MLWSSVKPFQSVAIPYRYRSGCRIMCPTGCLFPVSCVARCVLACRFLIRFVLPPRRACRASLRSVSSHPLILPALVSPARIALLTRPVPRVVGRGVIISLSSRHASRLPPLRFACPLLGVLTVILNAVAMGTVGCGAFVPRFHKLHLLSMGVVRISSSARRPLFSTFSVPLFLLSPFLVSDGWVGSWLFFVGFL